jgi:hypothetical protein
MLSKKPKKNSINKGHYLELMDRIHIVACMIDDHILNHPLSENEPEIQNKLDEALSLLLETYQIVGNKEDSYEDENNTH